jgi:hypothetical protein
LTFVCLHCLELTKKPCAGVLSCLQWDADLGAFGNFNEPYYRNFIACDFGALFKAAGFNCGTKIMASASKTLSFTKPFAASSSSSSEV